MHGMTKMQMYMILFGSGINFYGGLGELAHKIFIKIPGRRTQRRVSEFAQQAALQYYNMLVSGYATEGCHKNNHKQVGEVGRDTSQTNRNSEDIEIELSGKYEFTVTHNLLQRMEHAQKLSVTWTYNDKKSTGGNGKDNLSKGLVQVLHRRLRSSIGTTVTGFTKAIVTTSTLGERTHFYARPGFQGEEWYDWVLVHFEELNNHGDRIESHNHQEYLFLSQLRIREKL